MKKNSDKTKRNAPSYFINEVRNYPEKNAKGRDVFGKLHHDNLVFSIQLLLIRFIYSIFQTWKNRIKKELKQHPRKMFPTSTLNIIYAKKNILSNKNT